MHIGPLGLPEIIIIVIVIALIFGPNLFKKVGKRLKKTGEAAKKGIEAGAKENGHDIKLDEISKDDVMGKINEFQDKVDEKLNEAEKAQDEEDAKAKTEA